MAAMMAQWQSNWEAPTMFLDLETDTCMAVLPKVLQSASYLLLHNHCVVVEPYCVYSRAGQC